jgi:hypothetical protein
MIGVVLVPGMSPALVCGGAATYYVVHWAVRRVSVAKETAADVAGLADEQDAGDYARGLLALYEANLLPATTKGGTHPSLHDRLRKAGLEPDFERPKPPAVMPIYVIALVSSVVMGEVARSMLQP